MAEKCDCPGELQHATDADCLAALRWRVRMQAQELESLRELVRDQARALAVLRRAQP